MLLFGIIAVVVLVFIGVIVVIARQGGGQSDAISDRLTQFTERQLTLEEMELQQPFSQRVVMPMMRSVLGVLGKMSPQASADRVRQNLQQAGNPGNLTPIMFSGIRLALAAILLVVFGIVTFTSAEMPVMQKLMYTALGCGVGYMLPGIWLGQEIKKRKHNIQKALPDALDLLTISVEAGLAFDSAMQRVAEKWDNELSREFKKVLTDVRLGRARRDALRDMVARCSVDDVQTFIAAVIQAEQLGVSISKILRVQSDQMRIRRRQRAEEKAHQAPVKMLFPMVFLIFPALFVVILGPAVPKLYESFGGL
ncbi:type II secretion system F family protein [Chloroflexia bacterium SDU3-3]|nr:type II secretion system F family protein [Chloroflexia bacterium SDU3-3]